MSDLQICPGDVDVDAVVVGAGFGGLRVLYELRELGLSVRLLEAGSDVGGTWYWNRYPGARTDSESWVYAMSFSEELQQDWDWSARFPRQTEVLAYLQHVADRFGLREHIQFDTRVEEAKFDEQTATWTVSADRGVPLRCRYLIFATGLLSAVYVPPFEGLDSFGGETYLTARWPKEPVPFEGKRVAVIGTGATGVQIVPEIAPLVSQLLVFQRTPNYVLPARNHPLDDGQRTAIKRDYAAIWEKSRRHFFGLPMAPAGCAGSAMNVEERQRALDAGWERGGFSFVFETFDDMLSNPETNEAACEYIRNKIRAIVKDPETAERLCPKGYPLVAKRPPLGHFYYEAFNRDNVELVDVSDDPIERITPTGVMTRGAHYECDALIIATGFDAGTGAMTSIDIRGRGGHSLREKWEHGPRTYLGLAVDEFPNMFMISGPQSSFSNIPLVVDHASRWIGRAIGAMRADGGAWMEPVPEAVDAWNDQLSKVLRRPTILAKGTDVGSWLVGANIPGKPRTALFHLNGYAAYAQDCDRCADEGFSGFVIRRGAEMARR
jgi:cation diffusion facilitator CzcD-associated flavoprotein CzcO